MLAVCPKTRLWAQKRRINKYLITLCLPGIQNEIKGHKYSHFVTGRKVLSAEVPSSPSIPQTASCQLQREKLTVPSANLFEFCGSPFSRKPFSRPQSIVKLPDSGKTKGVFLLYGMTSVLPLHWERTLRIRP